MLRKGTIRFGTLSVNEMRMPAERTILEKALEIGDPVKRTAFLHTACEGDDELRRSLENAIADRDAGDAELATLYDAKAAKAAFDPKASEPPAERAAVEPVHDMSTYLTNSGFEPVFFAHDFELESGGFIGPYKVLEKLGEGGMGAVYRAEQCRPVRREVALKLIKQGMDTAAVIARFEAERQALALMEHENIAKVLDAGSTESGRPFFVMELVRGVPITKYAERENLPLRDRLEVFISVCRAIQHAHQKGIIHRDIKPSNVLVAKCDGKPVAKVIDFGLAKALDHSLNDSATLTRQGDVLGTLQYMSPEQAGLRQGLGGLNVDTRSDVYSLGVVLYELLTGSTPLGGASVADLGIAEFLRRIREHDSAKPSTRLMRAGGPARRPSSRRRSNRAA